MNKKRKKNFQALNVKRLSETDFKCFFCTMNLFKYKAYNYVIKYYLILCIGNCCPDCCKEKFCQSNAYCSTCYTSNCDQGYHVDVRYFRLLSVSIPNEVFERLLYRTILEVTRVFNIVCDLLYFKLHSVYLDIT